MAALEVLTESGIAAVTIDRLASRLGITRGSFYHHFKNRSDLLKALLAHWKEKYTLSIREDIGALKLPPAETLISLIRAIRHRHAADYDTWFRAWAMHDPLARKVVKEVDKMRLDYIRSLFEGIGFDGLEAESRARLFLYYEMAEPSVFAPQDPQLKERLIESRFDLLTAH